MSNHVKVICSACKIEFYKRPDHVKNINYCSKKCSAVGRSNPNAKWRDKKQIAEYMTKYRMENRERLNELANKRAKKNHERTLEIKAKYRINNRHKFTVLYRDYKGKRVNGDLTPEQWLSILDKYKRTCLCCGKQEPEIKITLDHIIPLSKNGLHTLENIQPLCKSCNSSKHDKIIDYRVA